MYVFGDYRFKIKCHANGSKLNDKTFPPNFKFKWSQPFETKTIEQDLMPLRELRLRQQDHFKRESLQGLQ